MKVHTGKLTVGCKTQTRNIYLSQMNIYLIAPVDTCYLPPINYG